MPAQDAKKIRSALKKEIRARIRSMKTPDSHLLMTANEVAKLLHTAPKTVHELRRAGLLKATCLTPGARRKTYRFLRADVLAFAGITEPDDPGVSQSPEGDSNA